MGSGFPTRKYLKDQHFNRNKVRKQGTQINKHFIYYLSHSNRIFSKLLHPNFILKYLIIKFFKMIIINKLSLGILVLLAVSLNLSWQQLMRFPDNTENSVVFTSGEDIWIAPLEGGDTVHVIKMPFGRTTGRKTGLLKMKVSNRILSSSRTL